MNRWQLLEIIKENGWKILRFEGNHYVVRKGEITSGFAIVHQGGSSEQPNQTVAQIFKKLGIKKGDGMSKFFKRSPENKPQFGTYGYELYAARESKRIPASDVGKAVGLSGSAILLYERNKMVPKPEIQEKLATLLMWPALNVTRRSIPTDVPPQIFLPEPISQLDQIGEPVKKRGWQAREKLAANRKAGKKIQIRRRVPSKVQPITELLEQITHDQFNDAMLTIRTYLTQLEKRADKWNVIKDLIKDEE